MGSWLSSSHGNGCNCENGDADLSVATCLESPADHVESEDVGKAAFISGDRLETGRQRRRGDHEIALADGPPLRDTGDPEMRMQSGHREIKRQDWQRAQESFDKRFGGTAPFGADAFDPMPEPAAFRRVYASCRERLSWCFSSII